MPIDPNDPQQVSTPDAVSNTPTASQPQAATPAPSATPDATPTSVQQPSPTPGSASPAKATQTPQNGQPTAPQPGTVSNTAPVHSSVQRASTIRQVAQALAGGARYSETIDPQTGATVRTQLPMSKTDIGMAIALEAISGSLAGLAQTGPGAIGKAAAAGFQQVSQQQQAQQAQQDAQAQQQLQNQTQALARRASAFEQNSRTILNTAQAERYGVDSLKDAVSQNADVLSAYDDAGVVQERNVSQDQLSAGMTSGKYSPTDQIAIPDGFTNLNGKYEQTFAIISNPSAKLPLTQTQWDTFAADHIQGFPAGVQIADGTPVPGYVLARANAQVQAINLMKQDFSSVSDALAKSSDKGNQDLAKSVPSVQSLLDDQNNGPVFQNALTKLQRFVSHADFHGQDFYESLQQMASPSMSDPRNPKQSIPNPSAGAAQVIAGAFGNGDPQKGWQILKAYHAEVTPTPISSEPQAEAVLSDPGSSSKAKLQARSFLNLSTQQKAAAAGAEERARQAAKPQSPNNANLSSPDALGFTPTVSDVKEANKRFGTFKKNLDDLSRSEQSYTQFQQALGNIQSGNWTGADSVVSLFNAIGLSAAPLAGRGFRINQNTIQEHEHARGWEGALQARLQGVQTGAVITPQQLRDYASIAQQARANQIVSTVNEMHNAGIPADAALPTGNGQRLTPDTASIFLHLAGGDANRARQAATAKGWSF